MALSAAEAKARRLEGLMREKRELTTVQQIRRDLIGGRPPASELKTPFTAVLAARTLYSRLVTQLKDKGIDSTPGDCAVCVGFISADLSVLGVTSPYSPTDESTLMRQVEGQISLGLVFRLVDAEAGEKERIVLGGRPFLTTTQTDDWFKELLGIAPIAMEDARLDATIARQ